MQALTALAHLGMRTAVNLAALEDVARQLEASAEAPAPPPSLLPRARALAVQLGRLAQHEGALAGHVPGSACSQGHDTSVCTVCHDACSSLGEEPPLR